MQINLLYTGIVSPPGKPSTVVTFDCWGLDIHNFSLLASHFS